MEAEESIKQEYPELFTGEIGKFNGGEIELMINPDVRPVAQKPRRIPVNMAEKAEAKIKQLLNQDIIDNSVTVLFPDNTYCFIDQISQTNKGLIFFGGNKTPHWEGEVLTV